MWLEFATYSGCTLVEPVERGYNVWDVVQNNDSEPASNTQLRHEPVETNNVPQLSSKNVSDGHGAVGQRDSTCPLDQNADVALVPEVIEEDEALEVAPTDTSACHIGNEAGAKVLAQDLCSEHVEQAQHIEPTILVTQGISAQAAHKIEPKPTHKELSEPVPLIRSNQNLLTKSSLSQCLCLKEFRHLVQYRHLRLIPRRKACVLSKRVLTRR